MRDKASFAMPRVLAVLVVLLICKVTLSVVIEFRHYIPPRFDSEFLSGRESYFWGAYAWAFYAHIVFGPITLLLGTLLTSHRLRRKAPAWHRRLGRVQGICILALVTPSGLWMARYAETGAAAGVGLGSLAIVTAVCVALGWRAAVGRNFAAHQQWMWRTYMLLCSAVVIRVIGGFATVARFDADWLYATSCWISWLVPLAILEAAQYVKTRVHRVATSA